MSPLAISIQHNIIRKTATSLQLLLCNPPFHKVCRDSTLEHSNLINLLKVRLR